MNITAIVVLGIIFAFLSLCVICFTIIAVKTEKYSSERASSDDEEESSTYNDE